MKSIRFFVLIAILLTLSSKAEAADGQPNVLFLVADDLNTWLLGDDERYAGKVVAPNIRKFGESGVVFRRAYTASPVCCPSRTAMLSGVSPWKSGLYHNGLDSSPSKPLQQATSLPKLFRDAGYFTAAFGKIAHGWDIREGLDVRVPHRRDPAPPGAPLTPVGRGEQDWGPIHLPESGMNDTQNVDQAIEHLQQQHKRPFFIACGLFNPHMPWYVPQEYFDMFPLEEVTTPELLEDDLNDVPRLGQELTRGKSKFVDQVLSHGLHKEAVQAYLATTAYVDAQLGRVLHALAESEHRDNTIVVLLSDHGFHLGEKHHWQKATLWEEATHCLLMFRVPDTTKPGGNCERFVSLQDVYPTLAELCQLTPPAYVDGRSLVPLLRNPNAEWISTAITALGDRHVSIRTERFRYIRYEEAQEEFYDCTQDPREWTNVIGDPEYSDVIEELRSRVPKTSDMVAPLPSGRRNRKN